jgi:exodeoxyribonuclease VII large subunit
MSKPLKSQWEFGELFPIEQTRRLYTVNEITGSIRRLLEEEFEQVWVTGEITNLRVQSSGHAYFSIKDSVAQLSCVLFRNDARGVDRELLKDGQKIVVHGELTVYEARGQYQLRVLGVELQGQGALQAAFEKLKQKLNAEGLFSQERKRPIPRFPRRIGLVTSRDGAALHDVLHTIQRRHPGLEILMATCRVQGQGAAAEIACSIQMLNEWASGKLELRRQSRDRDRHLDLILVTRGGGSLDDLWAFNEEAVARAIFASDLPVISAVGHEIDFTISDFVADLRAATPTAAAELVTEGFFSSRESVADARARLAQLVAQRLRWDREELKSFSERLSRAHPRRWLDQKAQYLDELSLRLARSATAQFNQAALRSRELALRLQRVRPSVIVRQRRDLVSKLNETLRSVAESVLRAEATRLKGLTKHLELLSPLRVLDRGYSITLDAKSGSVIKNPGQVTPGQALKTRLKSGEIESTVSKPGKEPGSSPRKRRLTPPAGTAD